MTKKVQTSNPEVELATKEYVLMINADTEGRIERAFHEQTKFIDEKFERRDKWLMGLFITLIVALFALIGAIITKL